MPSVPNRIQGAPFGTSNPNSSRLPTQTSAILVPGPAQAIEQFNHPDIPMAVSRAMNQLQQNVRGALSQAKADPTADKNLIEQLTVNAGGSNGKAPWTIVQHGLGKAYRGYRIDTVRGGFIVGHAAIAPTAQYPATTALILWTWTQQFGTDPVTIDIEVWC
jgi:hypothetical protein